jgi:hypothetical protein
VAIYILDTDTLSLLQTNHELVRTAVQGARRANHIVALNIVTVEEQFDGWATAHRRAKTPEQYARASRNLASTVAMWAGFLIYPQTEASLARLDLLGRQKLNVKKNDL